jgi:hypothetical protein
MNYWENELKKAETKPEIALKALMSISIPDPVQYDGMLAWTLKNIAKDALKEINGKP